MLHWAAQRAKVAQGLLTALVAMHRLQVHHRDIKPANILLSIPNGLQNEQADIQRAVVTDLGFTCVAGTDTDVWPGSSSASSNMAWLWISGQPGEPYLSSGQGNHC